MYDELLKKAEKNNKIIADNKETILKEFKIDVKFSVYDIKNKSNEELKKIIENQESDIQNLDIIIDIGIQNLTINMRDVVEQLKTKEPNVEFSQFYRTGIIQIQGIDVSVDDFYIKEVKDEHEHTIYNFVCTDTRINRSIFSTIDDSEYDVINIYPFKNSEIFYLLYLDKELFKNNKIIIDNGEKLKKLLIYINRWKPIEHKMVAETMIKY